MRLVFVAIYFFMLNSVIGQQKAMPANVESLVNSENEFSAYSIKHGIKESFLKYFDDKVILFVPHAVNGTGYYFIEPQDSGRLSWKPTIAEISNDGEFGFTMGPVQYQATYNPKDTVYHSHYFSVWQKKQGIWKVVLDKSIRYENKMPEAGIKYLSHSIPITTGTKIKKISFKDVINNDYSSVGQFYNLFCNDETIFVRKGKWPFTAKDSLPNDLGLIKTWKVLDGQIASSADFAYIYGVYELNNETNEKGYFIRVWVYQSNNWFLRVDIHSPFKK